MPAFTGESDLAAFGKIKAHPEFSQLCERVRCLGDDRPDHRFVAEPLADHEGVGQMQLHAVGLADRARDTALRIPGVGVGKSALGHQCDATQSRRV